MGEGGARARRAAVVWRQQTDISVIAIIPARTLWQGGSLRQWAATTAAVTRGYGNVHGYDGSGSVDSGNGGAKSVVTEAVAELMEVAVTRGGSGWLRHSAAPTFTLVLHYPHRIHTRHITKQFTFITLITRSHATHHRTYAPSPKLSLTHSLTGTVPLPHGGLCVCVRQLTKHCNVSAPSPSPSVSHSLSLFSLASLADR